MSLHEKKSTFRPDIQGLRAFAVGLVVVYHSGLGWLPGGYIGVDIFFVISGYLISRMLLEEWYADGRIDVLGFYARRMRRLLPAAAVVLLCTTAFARIMYSPVEIKTFSSDAIATAVYLSNFWFAHLATDYLASDEAVSPLLHTWSLAVEEQFYIFWPAFLILVGKTIGTRDQLRKFAIAISVVIVFSFLISLALTHYSQPHAFFGSPTRAWEFGVGAIIAVLNPAQPGTARLLSRGAGWLGLLLMIAAALSFSTETQFPGIAALLPVIGAALLIAFPLAPQSSVLHWILSHRFVQFFGNISYSFYLWHWPVFVFMGLYGLGGSWAASFGGIALSASLAAASYYTIENPFRFNRTLVANHVAAFGASLAIISLALGAGVLTRYEAIATINSSGQQRFLAARKDVPKSYAEGCHRKISEERVDPCVHGAPDSSRVIVLFGDSHAVHWVPAIESIARDNQIRLLTFTKSGCPSVLIEVRLPSLRRTYDECTRWRESVFREINRMSPSLVLLSNSYGYFGIDAATWRDGVRKSLNRLNVSGARVAIIRDTPRVGFNVPLCLSRAAWRDLNLDEECQFDLASTTNSIFDDVEKSELSRFSNMFRIDMSNAICDTPQCRVERDGIIMFSDTNHLAASFARSLSDELLTRLPKGL